MTHDMFILVVVASIFLLSLVGAIILFKFLKSTAFIKSPKYRAGGALAGFLLIYGSLYYSFDRMQSTQANWEPTLWTVTGIVKLEDQSTHDGAVVKHVPAKPFAVTDARGAFRLESVRMLKNEGMPEIALELEGYFPLSFEIVQENSEVDEAKRIIRMKDTLELAKIMQ